MNFKKIVITALCALFLVLGTACSTVHRTSTNGVTRPVVLNAEPQGGPVYDKDGKLLGTTPFTHFLSPRGTTHLFFTYPGYVTREVVLKAAQWEDTDPVSHAGNLAALAILPPVGLGAIVIDKVTMMDKDFKLPTIILYPCPQPVAIVAPQPVPQPTQVAQAAPAQVCEEKPARGGSPYLRMPFAPLPPGLEKEEAATAPRPTAKPCPTKPKTVVPTVTRIPGYHIPDCDHWPTIKEVEQFKAQQRKAREGWSSGGSVTAGVSTTHEHEPAARTKVEPKPQPKPKASKLPSSGPPDPDE